MTNPIVQLLGSSRAGAKPGDGTNRWLLPREVFVNTSDDLAYYVGGNGALQTVLSAALVAALIANAVAPLATTQQLNQAIAPLATTQALANAIAPLATTQTLQQAVAPLATTQALANAVAPLATTQQLNQAVAPLATTQAVTQELGAYAPLSSPALTGAPTAPANPVASNGTAIAVTADIEAKLARGLATPNALYWTGGPALRSPQNRAGDRPDMRDYNGFDASGNNDNADLMIAASVDSGANGYEINIPWGTVVLTKTLVNSGFSMRFKGQGNTIAVATNVPGANQRGPGTWLHFAHPNVGVQTIGQPGSTFRNLGTFRDQPVPSANGTDAWAPGNFDFDFDFLSSDVVFEDIVLFNATNGFRGRGGGSRLYASRVKGHAFHNFCTLQQRYDTDYVHQCRCYPYWSFDNRVAAYTYQNLIAYIVGRADSAEFDSVFCIEHYVGFYFIQTATDASNPAGLPGGAAYKVSVRRFASDVGTCAILVDGGVTGMDATFEDMYSQGYQGENPNLTLANAAAFPGLVTVYGSNNRLGLEQPWLGVARNALVYVGDGGSNTGNAVAIAQPLAGQFNLTGSSQGFVAVGSSSGSIYQGRKQAGFGNYGTIVGPGFTSNAGDF